METSHQCSPDSTTHFDAGLCADKSPIAVAHPLVDVRIAAWLLKPDALEVTDSPNRSCKRGDTAWNLEGLLIRAISKEAANDAVSAVQKTSGMMQENSLLQCTHAVVAHSSSHS